MQRPVAASAAPPPGQLHRDARLLSYSRWHDVAAVQSMAHDGHVRFSAPPGAMGCARLRAVRYRRAPRVTVPASRRPAYRARAQARRVVRRRNDRGDNVRGCRLREDARSAAPPSQPRRTRPRALSLLCPTRVSLPLGQQILMRLCDLDVLSDVLSLPPGHSFGSIDRSSMPPGAGSAGSAGSLSTPSRIRDFRASGRAGS